MEFLKKLSTMPKWIIKIFDFSILFQSVVLGFFIRLNFEMELMANYQVLEAGLFYAGVGSVSIRAISGQKGIISRTGLNNSVIVIKIVVLTMALVLMGDYFINEFYLNRDFLPLSVLVIASLTSFFGLVLYRLLGKEIYNFYCSGQYPQKNIVIFGAGEAGSLSKTVLLREGGKRQKIHAFLDDDTEKEGSRIDGIKVYRGVDKLKYLKEKYGITDLVISVMRVSPKRKREIIDECFKLNIHVGIIPSIDEWIQDGFSASKIRKIKIEDLLSREEISLDNPEVYKHVKDKVVLVTGAAGSIGSELCRQLAFNEPELVIMVDQAESALYDLEQEFKSTNWNVSIRPLLGDVRNRKKMDQIFKNYKPDIVFHAAAYKHVPMMEEYPEEAIRSNVLGTRNMADLSVLNNVGKFVLISTDKAVNPTSVMGASKRIAEIYVQSLGAYLNTKKGIATKFVITRFGNVLGSNGSVIPLFKKQIEHGGPVKVTHPLITRYFMTIGEACQLILEAGAMAKGGEAFIFDMGEPVKIVDLARKMIVLNEKQVGKDIKIVFTGLRNGEKLHEELIGVNEEVSITHHPKIRVIKIGTIPYNKVNNQIDIFEKLLEQNAEVDIVRHIKAIVPEFISSTSRFEVLDRMN
ncbi:nucleoside-diphosphate sugar epimerase/dehydratase [Echinicola jeungdonensis]|uniref:Polysaccharide biosynthesis protein n=1 Tax=Echinicola jeungdonensis TaxID=709343 RepID=A0ABV5J842_9BACT|nr:nucleoside-diphosphate sugar epimerase/dehydratase [Echinicola jeungdonensis]MDN3669934.1 nucleoside-diphosphate sugar epimerase/dehydratase [Echinicola jeungdonensis]